MTYIDTSDTGQGAKLKNQEIFGCLFLYDKSLQKSNLNQCRCLTHYPQFGLCQVC